MKNLYIGLMSGTSMDGIDAAVVDFSIHPPKLVETYYLPFEKPFRETLLALRFQGDNEIHHMALADREFAELCAQAVNTLLAKTHIPAKNITAIGHPGQTIRHYVSDKMIYSLQIGDPHIIEARTGIPTIADFRRRDIAKGGQGAPLAPLFHEYAFRDAKEDRAVVNIGGIANVTFLPADQHHNVVGFDTGPGNTLLDAWCAQHQDKAYDKNGQWASQGTVQPTVLNHLLKDTYFQLTPPKSTGFDYFNLVWLQKYLDNILKPVDIQTTLTELTATTIANDIKRYQPRTKSLILCGGGAHNSFLVHRLTTHLDPISVTTTDSLGIGADWVEAALFAYLAKRYNENK